MVPDEMVARGVADELLNELAARPDTIRSLPRTGAPVRVSAGDDGWGEPDLEEPIQLGALAGDSVADRLVEQISCGSGDHRDPIVDLAEAAELRGRVIVVSGWEENQPHEVGALLARLPALVKERGIAPADRPRVLIAAREGDLPETVFDGLDSFTTKVHWWWGAVRRLDTAFVVTSVRRGYGAGLRELAATEVITEIAGPDLVLAQALATGWNGLRATLLDAVMDSVGDTGCYLPSSAGSLRQSGNRPPRQLREPWSRGLADLWEGRVRISPVAAELRRQPNVLDEMVWRGQHRAFTPLVDDHRGRLEKAFLARASKSVLAELNPDRGQDPRAGRVVLELGGMAWAVATNRVRLPHAARKLLFNLRDTRNALAHLRPLSDEEIDTLAQLLVETEI
ncbi:hypothetical protein [Kutzneria albida]|uniref:Swt1-like HEPN domain-containing protein n=1 Tax=Kutzneria albida DSM 43870 TaxID=1449976 RepID=W5WIK5_9PSEU|nr:hypothetical protein [Kutzneria albida]AHI01039.1 hypothetical protein KALB_7681 [Kutzneria albida DSM 43870]